MPNPFISREDLSDYLGRDVRTDDGALIAVDAACDAVRTVAGQTFNKVFSDRIVLDGSGTDALVLPEVPVSSAGTVTVGGTALAGTVGGGTAVTNYALKSNGVLLRTAGAAVAEPVVVWPRGRQNVAVTYDHGYAEIPRDVRMVALAYASRLIVQGVAQSETIGDVSVRYGVNSTDFTTGERIILSKYRRTR